MRMRSGSIAAAISTPAWPSEATCTSNPSCLRVKTRTRWIFRSSSTTRTFVAANARPLAMVERRDYISQPPAIREPMGTTLRQEYPAWLPQVFLEELEHVLAVGLRVHSIGLRVAGSLYHD